MPNNSEIVKTEGIYKYYGKFMALADVSLSLAEGEMRAIIGPNGAGKSTLLKVMSAEVRADRGKIIYRGIDISNHPPFQIRRANISRSFQKTQIMPGLTVGENIKVAVQCFTPLRYSLWSNFEKSALLNEKADEILGLFGLHQDADIRTGLLSYADQRKVDLAMTFAGGPDLLLLDEPTSGMSAEESQNFSSLVSKVCRAKGITLIFVEHDMEVVFQVADKITVLNYGKIIFEGAPDDVARSQEVQQVYMGIDK